MGMLDLEIITPERIVAREKVDMVEANGTLGEFGILPGHIKFFTKIEVGEVRYMKAGKTTYLATGGGFAEVIDDKVTFLLDTGEAATDIDVERAKRAMEKAESALRELSMDARDYKLMEMALLRAIARIHVASKKL